MSSKRFRVNIMLPVGLLALLGMILLAVGLWTSAPAAARSNSGDNGAALASKSNGLWTFAAVPHKLTNVSSSAGRLINSVRADAVTTPGGAVSVPAGVLGGLPSSAAARNQAAGAEVDIQDALDTSSAATSYDFDIQITDPISGPEEAVGQYVADDKVQLDATDQQGEEREAIIWEGDIFVKDEFGHYQLRSRDDVDADPAAAAKMIGSFADSPNILESLGGLFASAENIDDQGEVQLNGVGARHYVFDLDGTKLLGQEGDQQIFGTGEIFVDLTTSHVMALSYDIDFAKFLSILFGSLSSTPTETPTPGTPEPEVHLIYNLRLDNYDADATFERPVIEEPDATDTPAARATNTRRPTNTPRVTRTPTPAPTDTPIAGISAEVDTLIGNSIDTMLSGLSTYHYDLESGENQVDSDGVETNTHLTLEADVENPDRVDMSYQQETSDNGESSVDKTHLIRVGSDVYVNNAQTNNRWKKYSIDDIGEDNLSTVIDVRSVLATADQLDDEDYGDVTAHHIAFTIDMQKLFGEDVDLSGLDAEGGGDIWIAADGGQILEMQWHYSVVNPDTSAMIEYQYDGIYSAFDEPLDIRPPSNR